MKKIEIYGTHSLRNEEANGFYTLIKGGLDKLPSVLEADTDSLKGTKENFINAFNAYDLVYKQETKSKKVESLQNISKEVGNAWQQSKSYAKVMLQHPDSTHVETIQEIVDLYDLYGNIARLAYSDKLSALTNLLQDLKKLNSTALEATGFKAWLDDLEEKTTAYSEALMQRTNERGEKFDETETITDLRLQLDTAYRELVDRINTVVDYEETDDYDEFISYVNGAIQAGRTRRRMRNTIKKNNAQEEDESSDPDEKPEDKPNPEPEEPEEPEDKPDPEPEEPEEPDPDEEEGGTHFEPAE